MPTIGSELSLLALPSHHLHGDDVRIHYHDLGEGPPVLLLHGLGSCGSDWFPITPALAPHHRLVLPDLRGHGQSSLPLSRDFSINCMTRDIVGLLDHLDLASADVIGLSLGGCVALQMACTEPRRVRRLVLVNTFARLQSNGAGMWKQRLRRVGAALGDMDSLAELVASSLFADPAFQTFVYERFRCNDLGSMRRCMISIARFDLRSRLSAISSPTLILVGDRDATVPRRCADQLASGIPNARMQIVADAGHALPYDQPDEFVTAVEDFLRS
ncbi:MAG: alpha/beta fold hydrolase [Caldilineales bacterium]|nr:alpha/beta fold hydrolase [Caldilineales bacterium]